MTDPCPRCAELEARLANFERETFEELRARVRELEGAVRKYCELMQVDDLPLEANIAAFEELEKMVFHEPFKPSGFVDLPESADPHANPSADTYMWVDTEGKVWLRKKDGTKVPHPLMIQKSDDEEEIVHAWDGTKRSPAFNFPDYGACNKEGKVSANLPEITCKECLKLIEERIGRK